MNRSKLDKMIKDLCKEAVSEEADLINGLKCDSVKLSASHESIMESIFIKASSERIYYKNRLSIILVAAVIFVLLSTTCMAIPGVREQIVSVFTQPDVYNDVKETSPTVDQLLEGLELDYNGTKYTVFDLMDMSDVMLNRIAGAGGPLYRFLDEVTAVARLSKYASAIKSRLVQPFSIEDTDNEGLYRIRLQVLSGAFMKLEGASDFLELISDENGVITDNTLPIVYYFITSYNVKKEDFIACNNEEMNSLLGYPFTENEIDILFSNNKTRIKKELSCNTAFYQNGQLYTVKDILHCDSKAFESLAVSADFTEYLTRLARTYELDGTEMSTYIDWVIERYLFFKKNA